MDARLEQAPVGVLAVSADGTLTDGNETALELIDRREDPRGAELEAVFPRSVEDSLLAAFDGPTVTEVTFEEFYPDIDRWLSISVVPTGDGGTVYLQDVTTRRRQAESLERLRTERERTAAIDGVLSEILAELVGASSREEIAATICDTLGDTGLYEFAWVGERDPGSDELAVRATAGETGDLFDAVREALEGTAMTPEERAIEQGRLQAIQPLAEASAVPEAIRMAGFADGVQSVLAIPLEYGSTVHGVVGVYASGTTAFSDRERASFETLGEVAGFAITAARNRNLLLSDGVTEVTFAVGDDSPLAMLSETAATELTLEGVVPQGEDALLCFLAVEGIDPAALVDAAADVEWFDRVRTVRASASGGTVEIQVRGSGPLLAVTSLGGTVRRAAFEDGTGEIVVDLPPDGDVRRIADAVSREYDIEILAKRNRERPVTTAREFRDKLDDRLTDRQKTVLRTAYLADYFESPRGSTAEEVAASLDITGSTLLHHLRAGQRKLLDVYLPEGGKAASRDSEG